MKVVQSAMTKADLFLGIFESYPGTLKCYETLYANLSHLIRMHECHE